MAKAKQPKWAWTLGPRSLPYMSGRRIGESHRISVASAGSTKTMQSSWSSTTFAFRVLFVAERNLLKNIFFHCDNHFLDWDSRQGNGLGYRNVTLEQI